MCSPWGPHICAIWAGGIANSFPAYTVHYNWLRRGGNDVTINGIRPIMVYTGYRHNWVYPTDVA